MWKQQCKDPETKIRRKKVQIVKKTKMSGFSWNEPKSKTYRQRQPCFQNVCLKRQETMIGPSSVAHYTLKKPIYSLI